MAYKEQQRLKLLEKEKELASAANFAQTPGYALTSEEKEILEKKGTEAAGSGEYNKFQPSQGYFACRKCGLPIYSYEAKFESGCGWPAFDKCYAGALATAREEDGTGRTEIVCANC